MVRNFRTAWRRFFVCQKEVRKTQRLHFEDRETWLAGRNTQGIGASEAAAVVGVSPWMTPLELWRLKVGAAQPKDLSGSPAVSRGVRMEPVLRDLYAAMHPHYTVDYHAYNILYQEDRPWLFATLDGEVTDDQGRRGILEIKTSTPNGKLGWAKWDGRVPDNYMTQILHQMLATGWDFVDLLASLENMDGDLSIRTYRFERTELTDDLAWLLEREEDFYKNHVLTGTPPAAILRM